MNKSRITWSMRMPDDYETHELEMAFKAGAASRDAEIHRLQMALSDTEQLKLGTAEKCDQLREQVAILLQGLEDAATSLETIALRSYGEESYLDSKQQMRGYAGSRAGVAREAIAKAKEGKL